MVKIQGNMHRAMLACTASALALTMARPAFAQAAAPSSQQADSNPEPNEVVVTGIRASIEQALQTKRNNDVISEVVTAQDIGKFPDKNVADSLGRLTGVNVVTGSANAGGFGETSTVSIRGTDP